MIVIITGHGGIDPGCSCNNVKEVDLNYNIAKNAYQTIKSHTDKVIWLNPDKSLTMDINTRGRKLQELGKKYGMLDVYTCHNDWNLDSNVNGISIIKSVWNTEDNKVYNDFMTDYEHEFGIKKRYVWTRNYKDGNRKIDHYGIHRLSGENAIVKIFEFGFISNSKDRNILFKKSIEIGKFFGLFVLKKNEIEIKKILYTVQVGAFSIQENAENLKSKLQKLGFDSIIKKEE